MEIRKTAGISSALPFFPRFRDWFDPHEYRGGENHRETRCLTPLPKEGGFFRQTWISRERLPGGRPPARPSTSCSRPGDSPPSISLKTDELWHFHAGDLVEHLQLDPGRVHSGSPCLAPMCSASQQPQLMVPRDVWQGRGLPESAEGLAPGPSAARGWALWAVRNGAGVG